MLRAARCVAARPLRITSAPKLPFGTSRSARTRGIAFEPQSNRRSGCVTVGRTSVTAPRASLGSVIVRSLVSLLRSGATSFALAALLGAALAGQASAGPFTRLQVLLPGETAAPGTPSGKTGTPRPQTVGVPFSITVKACDDTWTPVASVTHSIQVLSSDASATLPTPAQLVSGAG